MVTAALAFAKEEILWYFHHYELDLSGKRLKVKKGDNKLSSGVVFDFGITELMWLTNELRIRILAIKDCK